VTGGAGYIGSHTAKLLRSAGIEPVAYDNLSTGNLSSVRWGPFAHGDILDTAQLTRTLMAHQPEAVIHFAAAAYVGESVEDPSKYYRNNVAGTLVAARRLPPGRCRQGHLLVELRGLRRAEARCPSRRRRTRTPSIPMAAPS
jgi:UDP-glucose 4-epimerase